MVLIDDFTGGWDYSSLPDNVVIGRDCFLERKASFDRYRSEQPVGVRIGDRVCAYVWSTFNVESTGCIEIGDDCVLVGPVFMCADRITLGRRVKVSYNVTIADSDFHPRDPDLRMQDARANAPDGDRRLRPPLYTAPVVIDDDTEIGIGAIILKGVHIGAGARIGAGAVVTGDVPAGAVVTGNPAAVEGAS